MTTSRWRWVAIAGVGLLLAAIALGVWWAGNIPEQQPAPGSPAGQAQGPKEARPLIETGPVKLRADDNDTGKPIWEAMLKRLELKDDQATVELEEGTIFDKAGQAAVRLTAKKWKYDLNSKDFEIEGNVRIVSKRGIAFKTQKVKWINAQRDLVCPGPVTAIHKNAVIRTSKLVFHTASDRVECPTKVTITTQATRGSARSGTLDLKTQTMDLKGLTMTIIDVEAAKKEFEAAQRGT